MEYIEIGKIVNTFGIKGELKITSESDFIDYRFKKGKKVFFKVGNRYIEQTVSSYRLIKGNVTITVNELYDINKIQMYVGCSVYADKDDVPPLEDGEYLVDDLVGLKVYLEDETLYGEVNDFICIPSNNIIEIKLLDGTMELVPFVDEFIVEITDKVIIKKLGEIA